MQQQAQARLFVALWPGAGVRERLAAERDAWHWPPAAKPVPEPSLHLTLHFIGAFPRTRIATLEAGLDALPPAPTLSLRAFDRAVWPGGIAVLRFAPEPALATLHAAIGDVLAGLGVELDARPFAPHVTLARCAREATPPSAAPAIAWPASGFALVESIGGPAASYRVLRGFGGLTLP